MGKLSTTKGKRGEQEVVRIAKKYGLSAQRTAPLQAAHQGAPDVLIREHPALHFEVKRDEGMSVDGMVRQAERDARGGTPIVLWRRNRMGWRADVPMGLLFELLKQVKDV